MSNETKNKPTGLEELALEVESWQDALRSQIGATETKAHRIKLGGRRLQKYERIFSRALSDLTACRKELIDKKEEIIGIFNLTPNKVESGNSESNVGLLFEYITKCEHHNRELKALQRFQATEKEKTAEARLDFANSKKLVKKARSRLSDALALLELKRLYIHATEEYICLEASLKVGKATNRTFVINDSITKKKEYLTMLEKKFNKAVKKYHWFSSNWDD